MPAAEPACRGEFHHHAATLKMPAIPPADFAKAIVAAFDLKGGPQAVHACFQGALKWMHDLRQREINPFVATMARLTPAPVARQWCPVFHSTTNKDVHHGQTFDTDRHPHR